MSGPSSSTPAPGGSGNLPPAEPSVSMPQLMKFVIASLGGVVHPSLLPGIVHAAAQSAGIQASDIDSLMPSNMPKPGKGAAAGAKPKRATKKKDGDAPVSKRAGGVHPFTIFVMKAMERVKDVPEWRNRALRPDGKPVQRGLSMSITGALWKAMSDETREAFNKAYQPLCDQLKSERSESGVKAENIKERVLAYEATFSPETQEVVKEALPDKLPPVPSAVTSGALPEDLPEGLPAQLRKHVPGAVSSSEEDSDDDDEEDDEDEEKEEGAAKRKGEAQRLAREETERLARAEAERLVREEEERQAAQKKAAQHEEEQRKKLLRKEKKEAKEAKKKAADAAAGPSVVAGTPVTEDGKAKKKHKAKDHGAEEHTTAKKAKKAAAAAAPA